MTSNEQIELLSNECTPDFILPKPFSKVTLNSVINKFCKHYIEQPKEYILIVDDQKLFRNQIKKILSTLQLKIIETDTTENAKKIIKQFNSKIAFITLDLYMPGENGIKFANYLRKKGIYTPIIMITSNVNPEFKEQAFQSGITFYLSKPFNDSHLLKYANFILETKIRYQSDNILIIDDNPVILNMISNFLKFVGINTINTDNAEDAINLIKFNKFSAIIVDVNLPKINGIQLLEQIDIKNREDLMVLVYTSDNDPFIIYKAFLAGATDFIRIPFNFQEFYIRITNIIKLHRLISKLKIQTEELSILSIKDDLTGLYNKRFYNQIFNKKLDECIRYNNDLLLMVIDLNKFKEINDTYGHKIGDNVLKMVADAIKTTIRSSDIAIRFGGDEFIVIFTNQSPHKQSIIIERINNKINQLKLKINNKKLKISASIGTASFSEVYKEKLKIKNNLNKIAAELFNLADQRMYMAKKSFSEAKRLSPLAKF